MRALTLVSALILIACNPSSGPGVPEECTDASCEPAVGSSADQQVTLQVERTHTSARDILVSWTEVSGISDFKLDLADDESCASIKKSVNVTGFSTHLIDLEEGIWYLCLKGISGAKSVSVSSRSQLLVVDRQGPEIDAALEQNLAASDHAAISVLDRSDTECNWTTDDANLKISEPDNILTAFTAAASGTYAATLECEDEAENLSSADFVFNITVSGTTTPTGPTSPVLSNVISLSAAGSANTISLSWADGGGAQSYLVLSSSASITAVPVDGVSYTVGSALGAATVKAIGSATSFADTGLAGNTTRFYKVFAVSADGHYASGMEVSATAQLGKVLKATLTRTGLASYTKVVGLRTEGNYNYLCREDTGLGVINISNPAAPTQTTTMSLGNTATVGYCADVKIQGNYAYVADWDKGLIIVDITNPTAPIQKGSVSLTNASVIHVEGNYAYVAVEDNGSGGGLAIVNISNPVGPSVTSFTSTSGNAAGVSKVGNYVYLTHRAGTFKGLKVFDVSNPASPTLVKTLNRTTMEEIDIKDNYAYVTIGTSGIEIFDVSTPANPISKSTLATPGNGDIPGVFVVDNYAFVTDYSFNKLYVVDVTNKTAPAIVRTYTTNGGPLYTHVNGAYAYMSVDGKGLEVIEVFQFQ